MSRPICTALVALAALAGPAQAETIPLAGYNFESYAFADTVVSSFTSDPEDGAFFVSSLLGGVSPVTLEQAVVGPYAGDFVFADAFSYIQLGFTDNVLRNGPGADLLLVESGLVLDRFAVSLAPSFATAAFREYQTTFTGTYFGAATDVNRLNAASVDLSAFGVPEGAELTSITVGLYPRTQDLLGQTRVSFTAAAALYPDAAASNPNPVPAPPSLVLVLIAGGVGVVARGRKLIARRA